METIVRRTLSVHKEYGALKRVAENIYVRCSGGFRVAVEYLFATILFVLFQLLGLLPI